MRLTPNRQSRSADCTGLPATLDLLREPRDDVRGIVFLRSRSNRLSDRGDSLLRLVSNPQRDRPLQFLPGRPTRARLNTPTGHSHSAPCGSASLRRAFLSGATDEMRLQKRWANRVRPFLRAFAGAQSHRSGNLPQASWRDPDSGQSRSRICPIAIRFGKNPRFRGWKRLFLLGALTCVECMPDLFRTRPGTPTHGQGERTGHASTRKASGRQHHPRRAGRRQDAPQCPNRPFVAVDAQAQNRLPARRSG